MPRWPAVVLTIALLRAVKPTSNVSVQTPRGSLLALPRSSQELDRDKAVRLVALRTHANQHPFEPSQSDNIFDRAFRRAEAVSLAALRLEFEPLEVPEAVVDDRRNLSFPV